MALSSPFAQTFFVDSTLSPDGIYVPSVDVAFAFKDDVLPLEVQIRSTDSGYPDPSYVFHNAQCILLPEYIPTCDGVDVVPDFTVAGTYARFQFPAPIYLPPGEYALVFLTASTQYFAYMATLQESLIGSNRQASQQPYVGNLFRSQNSDAWTSYPNESLMFRVNRCVFNTQTPSTIEYDVVAPLTSNVNMDVFDLVVNDQTMGRATFNYSFASTDAVTGQLATNPTALQTNQNFLPVTRQVLTASNGSFKAYATMTSDSDYISPLLDPTRINLIGIEHLINNGNLSNSGLQVSGGSGYNPTSLPTLTVDPPTAAGGIQAQLACSVTANTLTAWFTETGSGYYVTPNVAVSVPGIVPSQNATIAVLGETGTSGGNSLVRYITRKVVLNQGFDAQDLQIFISANKQSGTDIQVYYKIMSAFDQDQNFNNKVWTRMVLATNATTFSHTASDLVEYKYISPAAASVPPTTITYTNAYGTFNSFTTFAIKICLFSSSTTTIPYLSNLRGIALA